jgi:ABC-type uncharacterized transport system YnjBCD permease subunit
MAGMGPEIDLIFGPTVIALLESGVCMTWIAIIMVSMVWAYPKVEAFPVDIGYQDLR